MGSALSSAVATGAAAYALLLTGEADPARYATVGELVDALARRVVARLASAPRAG